MLKRILTVSLIVMFAFSFSVLAGNIGNVNQTGLNNSGTIDQTGNDIQGYITQIRVASPYYSTGNKATVDQIGLQDYAEVYQNADVYSKGHLADVDQSGGNQNWAKVVQNGNDYMTADVDQIGNRNFADVFFLANSGDSIVYQKGDDNKAYQNRYAANSDCTIEQIGSSNLATQRMGKDGTPPKDSNFIAIQHGNLNTSYQNLYGSNWGFAPQSNNGTVNQTGVGNNGFQEMKPGSVANPDPVGNTAQLNQNGDGNLSSQSQAGAGHNSVVNQTGNNNTSLVSQSN